MKILMDARVLGAKPSGIGIYAYNYILALLQHEEVEMHVLTDVCISQEMNYLKGLQETEKITIHLYGKSVSLSRGVFSYFSFVKKVINEVKPDVFWEVNNLAPVKIRNPYGKYIVTIHDVFPMYMPECFVKGYSFYFKFGVNKTLSNVDAVIYDSNESKKMTEKYFAKSRKKPSFIGYVIVDSLMDDELNRNEDFFLYVGNLEKRKGSDLLIKSFEKYIEAGGTNRLVLAGKIREDEIQSLIDNVIEKYPDRVIYEGYIDENRKRELYNQCACFIFPTRAEGFGIPILEALSCGKPVITSELDICKEIVGQGVEYFSLANAETELPIQMKRVEESKFSKSTKGDWINKYDRDILGRNMFIWLQSII